MEFRLYENSHTRFQINSTYLIPFDDTIFVGFNLAFNDTNGKWKENFLTHKFQNACSSFKVLMGNQYSKFMNGMGIFDLGCPKKKGFYMATDILNTSMIHKMNIPKTFIYGVYKIDITYSRKNQILGCNQFISDIFKA
ncbi:Hypothetical protein CINCED_3A020554 [Cinara cedri]|uniref:Uncharacterized protein n=1 Tax=Cinara cedri TaxID=506608 RepID=A0A5E4M6K2_9HEMI|nr:Hypothetical protein CINCED_3A020554 [Cinara cedri]